MSEAALVQVAARLAAIEQTMQEFQKLAWALFFLASRSPVHLDVDRLEVERLEFKVDSVDVEELSGELNIGLTSKFDLGKGPAHAADADQSFPGQTAAEAAEAEPPASLPTQPIWPPPSPGTTDQPRPDL